MDCIDIEGGLITTIKGEMGWEAIMEEMAIRLDV